MNECVGVKRVALLLEDEFEEAHVTESLQRLSDAGVEVWLVGPMKGRTYKARHSTFVIEATVAAGAVKSAEIGAVVVPGGYAPDRMRMRHAMVDLVRAMVAQQKPVAAIDHAPQLLISAGVVRGRTITCWPSIAIDVKNAGGLYVDRPVVEDGPVITARKTDDLQPLLNALLKALGVTVPAAS